MNAPLAPRRTLLDTLAEEAAIFAGPIAYRLIRDDTRKYWPEIAHEVLHASTPTALRRGLACAEAVRAWGRGRIDLAAEVLGCLDAEAINEAHALAGDMRAAYFAETGRHL